MLSPRKLREASIRQRQRAAKLDAAKEAARRQELADEDLLPAAQRHGVLVGKRHGAEVEKGSDHAAYANPRVQRVTLRHGGVTFIRSSPIANLAARDLITRQQLAAASRLQHSWEYGGRGIGLASGVYGERAGGGMPQSGYISDSTLASLGYQNRQRAECEGAATWAGGFWVVLRAVALEGIDIAAWARTQRPARDGVGCSLDPRTAMDRLRGGLERLCLYYAALAERDAAGAAPMRAVEIRV